MHSYIPVMNNWNLKFKTLPVIVIFPTPKNNFRCKSKSNKYWVYMQITTKADEDNIR